MHTDESFDGGTGLEGDATHCLERLNDWHSRIQAIDTDDRLAQQRYRSLKTDIKEHHRDLRRVRRHPPLTDAELRWYAPAIGKAATRMTVPVNASLDAIRRGLQEPKTDIFMAIGVLSKKVSQS